MKTVLIVGGSGYLGTVMSEMLLEQNCKVVCLDRFFFGNSTVKALLNHKNYSFVKKDSRHVDLTDFEAVDAVIDLAGISNDPACELDEHLTESMNYEGPTRVAASAKAAGVPRYVMASSCSIYGAASNKVLNENSNKKPVSLYAKAKVRCESANLPLASESFSVTFLRLSTLFGLCYRMRFDLDVNSST